MNKPSLSLRVSDKAENKESLTDLVKELGKYISDEDVLNYKKSKLFGKLNKSIKSEKGDQVLLEEFKTEKLKDIKNIRELRRFVVKYKEIIEENIGKQGYELDYSKYCGCYCTDETEQEISLIDNKDFINALLDFLWIDKDIDVNKINKPYQEEVEEVQKRISETAISHVLRQEKKDDKTIEEDKNKYLEKLNEIGIIVGQNIEVPEYKKLVRFIAKNDINLDKVEQLFKKDENVFFNALKASLEYIELFFTDEFQYILDKIENKKIFYDPIVQEKINKERFIEFYEHDKEEFIEYLNNYNNNFIFNYLFGETLNNIRTSQEFIKNSKAYQLELKLREVDFSVEDKKLTKIKGKLNNKSEYKFLEHIIEEYFETIIDNIIKEKPIIDINEFYENYNNINYNDYKKDYKKKLMPILIGIKNSMLSNPKIQNIINPIKN